MPQKHRKLGKFLHLRQRIVGALLYGGFILIAYLLNIYTFLAGVFCILLLAIFEFKKISPRVSFYKSNTFIIFLMTLLISGFMLFSAMSLSYFQVIKILVWIAVLHHSILIALIFGRSFEKYKYLPDFVMSFFYIGLSFGALYVYAVPFTDYEKWRVILVLLCVWGTDIGAYFVGSLIGRFKLAPHVSPNKTWEGLLGGWVLAAFLGYFLASWINLDPIQGGILGSVIALTAVGGDLVESKLKRTVSLKDSGKLLPGHGGILDRIDGYLYCQPYVALIFIYLV